YRSPVQTCTQRLPHRLRSREAACRVWIDGGLDRVRQPIGQILTKRPKRCPPTLRVPIAQLTERASMNGIAPRRQVKEQHAEAVEIALRAGRLTVEEFRRNVRRRARERTRSGRQFVKTATGSEIAQYRAAAGLPEYVLGLHVAVDETGIVHRGQCVT